MVKNRLALIVGFVSLLSASVAIGAQSVPKDVARADKHFKPRTAYDPFEKSTTTVVDVAPMLGSDESQCSEDVITSNFGVELERTTKPGSAPEVLLHVTYEGSTWLYIDADAPLQFLVGDSVVSLELAMRPAHDLDHEGNITEAADVSPTPAQLRFIGSAGAATMRVTGKRGRCDVKINAYQLRMMLLFDQRVLGDTTGAALK